MALKAIGNFMRRAKQLMIFPIILFAVPISFLPGPQRKPINDWLDRQRTT